MTELTNLRPTEMVSVREVFGIDTELKVPAFAERSEHVPAVDPAYRFNPQATLAILAGWYPRVLGTSLTAMPSGRMWYGPPVAGAARDDLRGRLPTATT